MKKLFSLLLVAYYLLAANMTMHAQTVQSGGGVLFTASAQPSYAAFQTGLYHHDLNNSPKAREFFNKAIEQDPKSVMALTYRATYAHSPQEFMTYLEKAKANLESANAFEKLYYAYTETAVKNDWEQRLAIAQKMVTQYPDKARVYLLLGETYARAAETAKARTNFQKAIKLEPAWAAPYMQLTFSYLLQSPKDIKSAEKTAKKLVSIAPAGSTYVMLGDVYRAQNNLAKAAEVYSKGIEMDAGLPQLFIKRGHAHTFLENYDKAKADYEQAGIVDDVPINSRNYYALTFVYEGMPEKAIQSLLQDAENLTGKMNASEAVVAKSSFYHQAAYIAMHTNEVQQLKQVVTLLQPISDALSSQTGNEEAKLEAKAYILYWEGLVKALEKDYPAAHQIAGEMKVLLEPIKDPRKLEEYEFLKGYTLLQQKDYQQAIAHLEKSGMDNQYVVYLKAKAYEGLGNTAKAKALYKGLADYNFNEVGYALVRNEARKKQ